MRFKMMLIGGMVGGLISCDGAQPGNRDNWGTQKSYDTPHVALDLAADTEGKAECPPGWVTGEYPCDHFRDRATKYWFYAGNLPHLPEPKEKPYCEGEDAGRKRFLKCPCTPLQVDLNASVYPPVSPVVNCETSTSYAKLKNPVDVKKDMTCSYLWEEKKIHWAYGDYENQEACKEALASVVTPYKLHPCEKICRDNFKEKEAKLEKPGPKLKCCGMPLRSTNR